EHQALSEQSRDVAADEIGVRGAGHADRAHIDCRYRAAAVRNRASLRWIGRLAGNSYLVVGSARELRRERESAIRGDLQIFIAIELQHQAGALQPGHGTADRELPARARDDDV